MNKKIALVVIAALGIYGYSRLSKSKKRFLRELCRQVPWLVPRYFV